MLLHNIYDYEHIIVYYVLIYHAMIEIHGPASEPVITILPCNQYLMSGPCRHATELYDIS